MDAAGKVRKLTLSELRMTEHGEARFVNRDVLGMCHSLVRDECLERWAVRLAVGLATTDRDWLALPLRGLSHCLVPLLGFPPCFPPSFPSFFPFPCRLSLSWCSVGHTVGS